LEVFDLPCDSVSPLANLYLVKFVSVTLGCPCLLVALLLAHVLLNTTESKEFGWVPELDWRGLLMSLSVNDVLLDLTFLKGFDLSLVFGLGLEDLGIPSLLKLVNELSSEEVELFIFSLLLVAQVLLGNYEFIILELSKL
jgi:hypothetical protein